MINRLLCVLLIMVFLSCSDDDSGAVNTSELGTYSLRSLVPSEVIDADADGIFENSDIINLIDCEYRLILSEGNNFFFNMNRSSVIQSSVCSSSQGLTLSPVICNGNFVNSGSYTLNDDGLTLVSNDEEPTIILEIIGNEVNFTYTGYFYTNTECGDSPVQFVARFTK